jgi:hypothetical protein
MLGDGRRIIWPLDNLNGAITQEAIDAVAVLNALRAALPLGVIHGL